MNNFFCTSAHTDGLQDHFRSSTTMQPGLLVQQLLFHHLLLLRHIRNTVFLCLKSPKLNTVGKHFMFLFLKQTRITHFETFHLLALMILIIVVVLYVTALRVKALNAAHGWDVSHIESMYKCTNIALIFTSLMSKPWPWCLCSTDKGCHLQAYCEHTDINFNLNLRRHKEEVV